jgi:replicative DNA helicase
MLFHKKYTLFTDKMTEVTEVQVTEAEIDMPDI